MMLADLIVPVDFNGLVLFTWPDLATCLGGAPAEGRDLLREFTTTDLGDRVLDAGVTLPVLNLDDGDYRVRVFDAPVPPDPARRVAFSDPGFVLSVAGQAYVADAAVFLDWEEGLGWQAVPVPAGRYAATVEGVQHLDDRGAVRAIGYDLVLLRVDALPARTAEVRGDSRVPWQALPAR